MSVKIVIAEDEDITRKHLLYALKKEGYDVFAARNGREALDLIERDHFDILITDVRMPEMSGIELLERVKAKFSGIEVMVITGFGSIDSAVEAMKKGAYEYITKPFNLDELILKVKNIQERRILKRENAALKAYFRMQKGVSIIARSKAMQKIMSSVEDIRDTDRNVLLTGESGSGKSLLSKMIHFTSRRQNMPFLSINCAAIPGETLEKELFGCEHNVGGDSVRARQGLIEIADGGTLFINGITELSLDLQQRLLSVIEAGEFFRISRSQSAEIDVRFIAAANHDLRGLIEDGKFMEDLYYRLNAIEIFVPPLREHKEDIEPLCTYFLQKHFPESAKNISGFTKEAMDILMHYSFPGNVRELENLIERALIIEKGFLITPESLPRSIKMFRIETFHPDRIQTISEITRDYAEKVLDLVEGDKVKAAELLGIPELSLWKILKEK